MSTATLNYKDALKACRKVGTAHAQGDALRAMYADMIAFKWYAIGNAEKIYTYLQSVPSDERTITDAARELLRDSNKTLDVVLAL